MGGTVAGGAEAGRSQDTGLSLLVHTAAPGTREERALRKPAAR
ncbi:hypothetical protein [Streptomyces sp. NPDC127033]